MTRGVVDSEALTVMTVELLVVLAQNAAIENRINAGRCHFSLAADVVHLPRSCPEIESSKRGFSTRGLHVGGPCDGGGEGE